jgi:hypothetical protein
MNRTAVESSNVAAVGYEASNSVLEVEFHSGSIYQYHGVPAGVYWSLVDAPSKGQFFNNYIKGAYRSVRVDGSTRLSSQPQPQARKSISAMQAMYLEIIRASSHNEMDGPEVVDSLLANRDLWESCVLGSSFGIGLILRDLEDGYNNADTLYILCEMGQAVVELTKLAYEEWRADSVQLQTKPIPGDRIYDANVNMCVGGGSVVLAVWWD